MRIGFFTFIFIFLAFQEQVAFANSASKMETILDAQIEISQKSEIAWSDLVRWRRPSEDVIKRLSELKLENTLSSEINSQGKVVISRSRILSMIKDSGLKDLGLLWQIPEKIQIQRLRSASAAEIERKVENQLRLKCDDCEFQIFIDKLPTLQANTWKIDASDAAIKNSLLVPLQADGKNLWVSLRLKTYKNIPVTTRLIPASQKIQSEDLELKRMDISNLKDGFLPISQMVGMSLIRSFSVGTPVGASDVKREMTIKKGQMIKALVENSDFEINVNALAEDSGYVGDVIKIRSSDTQKIMMGKIKNNNSVVVQ